MTHEGGDAPARTGTPPVTQPRTPYQGIQGHAHSTPRTGVSPALASARREKQPRWTVSDLALWALFVLATLAVMYGFCGLVWAALS